MKGQILYHASHGAFNVAMIELGGHPVLTGVAISLQIIQLVYNFVAKLIKDAKERKQQNEN